MIHEHNLRSTPLPPMAFSLLNLLTLTAVALHTWAAPTADQMLQFLEQYNKVSACNQAEHSVSHFIQDWAYPRVIEIAKGINYTALDPNVIGRVDGKSVLLCFCDFC
jgi:hypothetical protein